MAEQILVADKSPTVRNVAQSLLKKHGYTVLLADNGARALTLAETKKPELIFLDDSMPMPGGEGAWSALRQRSGLKDVPVVMLVSGDRTDRQQELKEAGADGFINKPFNPREILDQAEKLLRKEKTASAGEGAETGKESSPKEDHSSEPEEPRKDVSSADEGRSEGGLNVLETSDVMEDLGRGGPGTEEEPAHGFDWFLHELKKETRKHEQSASRVEETPGLSLDEGLGEEVELKDESEPYEVDEHEKSFEDFVRDLKQEVEHPHQEQACKGRPSAAKVIERPYLDQLISHLKEKIPERVAREVAGKLSQEFLEKIIREEIARIEKKRS
jgi:two-component system chemotaxis response regulator CheY